MSNGNILSICSNFETPGVLENFVYVAHDVTVVYGIFVAVCQAHVLWVDGRKVSQCSCHALEVSRNKRVLGRKGDDDVCL